LQINVWQGACSGTEQSSTNRTYYLSQTNNIIYSGRTKDYGKGSVSVLSNLACILHSSFLTRLACSRYSQPYCFFHVTVYICVLFCESVFFTKQHIGKKLVFVMWLKRLFWSACRLHCISRNAMHWKITYLVFVHLTCYMWALYQE